MDLSRLLPPRGIARALTIQTTIYAIGSGLFIAGSVFFFTRIVGLSARQVGLGLSVAGLVSFACSMPMGVLADRLGHRRTWLVTVLIQVAIFAAYPLVRGFGPFVVVAVLLAVVESASANGRGAYTIAILPPEIRVRTQAFQRSALNVGFTLGGLLAGIALVIDTRLAYDCLVLGYAAVLLISAVFILRLPEPSAEQAAGTAPKRTLSALRPAVLGDHPVLAVSVLVALLAISDTLILVVLPLWIIQRTDAPNAVYAWLLALNCVLVAGLQVRASNGAEEVRGATRALRRSGVFGAVGCLTLASTVLLKSPVTIVVLALGMVVMTGSELLQSAGFWGIVAELSPAGRRAEYQAAFYLGSQGERMIGPVCFTAVVITVGAPGWLLIAALFLAAAVAIGPAVAWTARTARTDGRRQTNAVVVDPAAPPLP
jgi:MFS family permease